ncbi:MAG: restriction endonuclease subunit S [Marinosulfonomonas sp.]|nr:MAG: restriction endonuclease subunit S [Marinosulfonomonas sp.]
MLPRLRFPEFREAGAWEEKRLGDVAKFTGGGTPSKGNEGYWNGNLPWISSSDISEDSIFDLHPHRFITEQAIKESATKIVPANSILLVSRVGVGKLAISNKPICTSQDFTSLTPMEGNLVFFAYLLKSRKTDLLAFNQGMAIKGFTKDDITKLSVLLPSPPEQQKIADCLSSLDDLITARGRKVAALERHKKGLMQQLFPATGQTTPQLRFPEFREAEAWEISSIDENAIKVGSGITPRGGSKNYRAKGRPFIRSQNIGWGKLLLDEAIYIDEETHSTFAASEIQLNDVLLNITGASIGRSAVADERISGGNVNQHVCIIRVNPDKLIPLFLNQFLISDDGQRQIDSFQAGGNREGLNFAQIRSFDLPLPSPPEQQKIADCLTSLDDLIRAEAQKLGALKAHKKGLMQQLFPTPDGGAP